MNGFEDIRQRLKQLRRPDGRLFNYECTDDFLCRCVLLGIIQDGINHLGIWLTSPCGVFQIDIGPDTGNAWRKRVALNAPFWMFNVLVRFKVAVDIRIGWLQIWPIAAFLYGKCTVGDISQTLKKVGFLRFGSGKLNSKFIVAQIGGLAFACLAESLEPCIQRRKHFRAVELFANAFHESTVFLLIGIHFDLLMFTAVATFLY